MGTLFFLTLLVSYLLLSTVVFNYPSQSKITDLGQSVPQSFFSSFLFFSPSPLCLSYPRLVKIKNKNNTKKIRLTTLRLTHLTTSADPATQRRKEGNPTTFLRDLDYDLTKMISDQNLCAVSDNTTLFQRGTCKHPD